MRLLVTTYAAVALLACHGGSPPPETSSASGTPTVDTTGPVTKESSGGATDNATTGGATPDGTTPKPAADPVRCGEKTCDAGEECISYYGIAGARGPQFHECGIKCRRGERNDGCPRDKKCIQISDGPGDVCR